MSITPGFTTAEIREFVHEYQLQPHGQKGPWLREHAVSYAQLMKWRKAVFGGDLDRGLVPRHARGMTLPPKQRTELAKQRAAERAAHQAETEKLHARIRELEETNAALGKAIGLLHQMSEQEPAAPRTTDAEIDMATKGILARPTPSPDPTQHAGLSGASIPEPSQPVLDLAAHVKRPGSTPVQDARGRQDVIYPDEDGPEGGA